MVKLPSKSEVVPLVVPRISTVAPGRLIPEKIQDLQTIKEIKLNVIFSF